MEGPTDVPGFLPGLSSSVGGAQGKHYTALHGRNTSRGKVGLDCLTITSVGKPLWLMGNFGGVPFGFLAICFLALVVQNVVLQAVALKQMSEDYV